MSIKVHLILPAFNEAASIASVVVAIKSYGQVIVVDDASTDDTGTIAKNAGAVVVKHALNGGYDQALASGLAYAIMDGADFAITMDADGQHQPNVLSDFIRHLEDGADLVIGQRDRFQRFSEFVFSVVAKTLWGVHDPLCGMKGYRLEIFGGLSSLSTYTSIGTELTIRALRSGCHIVQIPIVTLDRVGISRFGNGFLANYKILKGMMLGLFCARPFYLLVEKE